MVEAVRSGLASGMLAQNMAVLAPRLKIYGKYINSYESYTSKIKEYRATLPDFEAFMQRADASNPTKLRFADLIIEPVQKLPRYELQLREILKFTSTTNPNYPAYVNAFALYREVSLENNEGKRMDDARLKLFDLKQSVRNCPDTLIKGNRRYIGEYNVKEYHIDKPQKEHAYCIYMFNDSLMLTLVKSHSNGKPPTHDYVAMFPLENVSL